MNEKPKVGDKIVCVVDHLSFFTKGKIYTVIEPNEESGYHFWVIDDEGDPMYGWLHEFKFAH